MRRWGTVHYLALAGALAVGSQTLQPGQLALVERPHLAEHVEARAVR